MPRKDAAHFSTRYSSSRLPRQAIYEVTYRCNFRCVHCYCRARGAAELPLGEIRRLLDNLARAGVLHLTFTGGEPFMRRNFLDIIEAARSRRFSVILITNGSLLSARKVKRLGELLPLRVDLSVYGASEATYRRVTLRRGMFVRVMRTLDMLADAGIKMVLKAVLMRENVADAEGILRIARERGLGIRHTPMITTAIDGSREPLRHALRPSAVCRLVREGILNAPRRRRGRRHICGVGYDTPAIGPDGTAYPCLEVRTPFGRLPGEELSDVWRTSDVLRGLRQMKWDDLPRCARCRLLEFCNVCPGSFDRDGGSRGPIFQCRLIFAMEKEGLLGRRRPRSRPAR